MLMPKQSSEDSLKATGNGQEKINYCKSQSLGKDRIFGKLFSALSSRN